MGDGGGSEGVAVEAKCQTSETHYLTRCVYCLGFFVAQRTDAETCSGACREAVRAALACPDDDVWGLRPLYRRYTISDERERATGWGGMSARKSYEADVRVRFSAGRFVPESPMYGPGFGPDDLQVEERNMRWKGRTAP